MSAYTGDPRVRAGRDLFFGGVRFEVLTEDCGEHNVFEVDGGRWVTTPAIGNPLGAQEPDRDLRKGLTFAAADDAIRSLIGDPR